MKIRNLLESFEIINRLANTPMPARIAWNVHKFIEEYNNELQRFNKIRDDVMAKDLPEDNKITELNELLDAEVAVTSKLLQDDLEQIGMNLTPLEVKLLLPFLE